MDRKITSVEQHPSTGAANAIAHIANEHASTIRESIALLCALAKPDELVKAVRLMSDEVSAYILVELLSSNKSTVDHDHLLELLGRLRAIGQEEAGPFVSSNLDRSKLDREASTITTKIATTFTLLRVALSVADDKKMTGGAG